MSQEKIKAGKMKEMTGNDSMYVRQLFKSGKTIHRDFRKLSLSHCACVMLQTGSRPNLWPSCGQQMLVMT